MTDWLTVSLLLLSLIAVVYFAVKAVRAGNDNKELYEAAKDSNDDVKTLTEANEGLSNAFDGQRQYIKLLEEGIVAAGGPKALAIVLNQLYGSELLPGQADPEDPPAES